MSELSNEFLEHTAQAWSPLYGRPLTLEEAREITENTIGLFRLLERLDRKYAKKTKSDL